MNPETRSCQNCKKQFVIDAADFDFYAKMAVPPPTFCPACRFERRLMFRNERVFYKRDCGLCGQSIVSVFSPDKPYTVYCQRCWWSDKWDPAEYYLDYDPARPFFEQFLELRDKTPYMALMTEYASNLNSEYVNHAAHVKNCYLIFNADFCENTLYATLSDYVKDSMDANVLTNSELCYETIDCDRCFRTFFSEDCVSSTDIYFSKDMSGCNHCFGCVNLRNKSYCIWNQQYSKEEYEAKLKEFGLDRFDNVERLRVEAKEFWKKFPHKQFQGTHNVNSSGSYFWECKNARDMYQARYVEDGRFCQFITLKAAKDVYDYTEWGAGAERIYDCLGVGQGASNTKFSFLCWDNLRDCEYSFIAVACSNIFGCANLRKKQFCILNKQYSEDEYRILREKIIKDMDERPYIDAKGRVFKYGEFFPYDLSLFDYNETHAAQYSPLSKEQVLANGFRWREPEPSRHEVTLAAGDVPPSIHDVSDDILKEAIGCAACGRAFRIVSAELMLLRRFGLPIHRKCSDCRHIDRLVRTNPSRLFQRNCAKCDKEIETSFAPERPEIVYCEQCYQSEVV